MLSSKNKNNFLQVQISFHDPWLNFGSLIIASKKTISSSLQLQPMTPKIVKEVIECAIAKGWNLISDRASLHFVFNQKIDDRKNKILSADRSY